MNLLAILEHYREDECPNMGTVRSGADLYTLTRGAILHECEELGFDVLALYRLGAVDSRREELAKLLHGRRYVIYFRCNFVCAELGLRSQAYMQIGWKCHWQDLTQCLI